MLPILAAAAAGLYFLRGKTRKNPGRRPSGHRRVKRKNPAWNAAEFTEKKVHISRVRPGDVVVCSDGHDRTIGAKDIKRGGFLGTTLWGDSYRSGTRLVSVLTPRADKTRKNPGTNVASIIESFRDLDPVNGRRPYLVRFTVDTHPHAWVRYGTDMYAASDNAKAAIEREFPGRKIGAYSISSSQKNPRSTKRKNPLYPVVLPKPDEVSDMSVREMRTFLAEHNINGDSFGNKRLRKEVRRVIHKSVRRNPIPAGYKSRTGREMGHRIKLGYPPDQVLDLGWVVARQGGDHTALEAIAAVRAQFAGANMTKGDSLVRQLARDLGYTGLFSPKKRKR
jgi:hypothetical protein